MRSVAVLVSLGVVLAILAGCSESPFDAGVSMAEDHVSYGLNPPPAEQARMQAELEAKTAEYTVAEKQEFMKGYLQGVMEGMQDEMASLMTEAMANLEFQAPVDEW